MLIIFFYIVYVLFCINESVDSTTESTLNKKEEEFYLKAIELIDLIIKERLRKQALPEDYHEIGFGQEKFTAPVEDRSDVDARAVARKVWSRWSKWSECSATCGPGATTRRRLCVAGRCAPGEREEQSRPCRRRQQCEPNQGIRLTLVCSERRATPGHRAPYHPTAEYKRSLQMQRDNNSGLQYVLTDAQVPLYLPQCPVSIIVCLFILIFKERYNNADHIIKAVIFRKRFIP